MDSKAVVIADSISLKGARVTTMQLRMHRFILPELNTHRMFSRNTSSSRAIPTHKLLDMVMHETAMPVRWGINGPGMQDHGILEYEEETYARSLWANAAESAAHYAQRLLELGVHKQVTNRLLEPFMWANTIVTATEWEGFFKLRAHEDAQPEFADLAYKMRSAMDKSEPEQLQYGEWHLPYADRDNVSLEEQKFNSVARCARVSYLTFEGKQTSLKQDKRLYNQLLESGHMSPFEHQCLPNNSAGFSANLWGWTSLRHLL